MKSLIHMWLISLSLLIILFSPAAGSHELRPAIADLTFPADQLEVSLLINLEALIAEIGPEHDDTDESPNAQTYKRLREAVPQELEAQLRQYLPTLLDGIQITDDRGVPSPNPFQLVTLTVPEVGDTRLPRDSVLVLRLALDNLMPAISWQWDSRFGPLILRVGEAEDGGAFSQYLQPGQSSETIALSHRKPRDAWSVFGEYVVIGFEHIIPKGLDHILFVIGLFLLSPYWKPIAWQVTVFTLAHTVTLALSTFELIDLSPGIVEPLIALSITAVCVENVLGTRFGYRRLIVVLLFGLLHGLGFASVLGQAGLSKEQFLISLLGFNLGVELGQLAVIFLCFLLVGWWFRERSWYRRGFSVPTSTAIGAIGLYWFVTRIAG